MQTQWWQPFLRLTHPNKTDQIVRRLQEMLDAGFRLDDDIGEMGEALPPMVWAVIGGVSSKMIVAEMLRLGANPNVQRKDTGGTPLMWASEINVGLVPLLLEGGANTEIQDNEGQTALHWAALHLRPQAVSLLLAHGANRFHRDHANRSAGDKARIGGSYWAQSTPMGIIGQLPPSPAEREAGAAAKVAEIIALLETKVGE